MQSASSHDLVYFAVAESVPNVGGSGRYRRCLIHIDQVDGYGNAGRATIPIGCFYRQRVGLLAFVIVGYTLELVVIYPVEPPISKDEASVPDSV